MRSELVHLDCTLRDGGYYNQWDFSLEEVNSYLIAVATAGINVAEVGFRFRNNSGFKGACAFSSDDFLRTLDVPEDLDLGIMLNAADILEEGVLNLDLLERLVPELASDSPVKVVRLACHIHEFEPALPASNWLKSHGYLVGFNLMQIADRSQREVETLAKSAAMYPLDVLYFADSLGGMHPADITKVIHWLRSHWQGAIGVHTHNNLGLALSNTLQAMKDGASWLDTTITGMGRGPGNAQTEELVIELSEAYGGKGSLVPLMSLICEFFKPLQVRHGWGTNPFYYLAGKYGIHPTFVQEMMKDARYSEEDVFAVLEHLKQEGGKSFSIDTLDSALRFFRGKPVGDWRPVEYISNKDVLLLGAGPGTSKHREAIERFIRTNNPVVIALNTQASISAELIDLRVACHPVRLLADCKLHVTLPQPLVTPASMLPSDVQHALAGKNLFDFGVKIESGSFEFHETHCTIPNSLVVSYALAIASSGGANQILMAGFDGYGEDDPRNHEMDRLISLYRSTEGCRPLLSITPSKISLPITSVYGLTA